MVKPLTQRIETATDWLVGLVSPYRRHLRSHFRKMEADQTYRDFVLTLMRVRGYRAARSKDSQTPFTGGVRSADAEILRDLPNLINRSRELNRDDPVASGLTQSFVDNVVGTGMRLQARTGVPETNKRLESVIEESADRLFRAESIGWGAGQRLILRKMLEDGGVFVKRAKRDPTDPLWFEIVEKDRVCTPPAQNSRDPKGQIRDGVEFDSAGVRTAYWVRKHHPGDTFTGVAASSTDYMRVDATDIFHVRMPTRPGQTHGVPWFHAILQDLRDLDLLLVASLKRVQIAACLSVFIESQKSIPNLLDVTAKKYGYKLDQKIEPGMIFKLFPDEKASMLLPNFPTPELVPFVVMLARRIGAALGISWQIVLKDFSDSTYSSARTDLLEARIRYRVLQHLPLRQTVVWIYASTLEDARLRGDMRMRGVADAQIRMVHAIANGWHWVDPLKEVQAIQISLLLGITTLRDVCASQGLDWEEVMVQRLQEEKREQELRKQFGLNDKAALPAPPPDDKEDKKPSNKKAA